MNFHLLPEADGEAIAAALWYDEQRLGLGDEFIVELEAGFRAIYANAASLPQLENYSGPHNIRRYLLNRFPYVLIVACRENEVLIVAIAHTRRRPLYWLDRLN